MTLTKLVCIMNKRYQCSGMLGLIDRTGRKEDSLILIQNTLMKMVDYLKNKKREIYVLYIY